MESNSGNEDQLAIGLLLDDNREELAFDPKSMVVYRTVHHRMNPFRFFERRLPNVCNSAAKKRQSTLSLPWYALRVLTSRHSVEVYIQCKWLMDRQFSSSPFSTAPVASMLPALSRYSKTRSLRRGAEGCRASLLGPPRVATY